MLFLKRLTLQDRLILIGAVLGLGAFLYLLSDDSILTSWNEKANGPVIGTIEAPDNDVRQKHAQKFEWKPVRKKRKLYEGDSVFTGVKSTAKIYLSDGSELDITPNSLVVLNRTENQMNLDLEFGTFKGTLAETSNLQIKVGNETVVLGGSNAQVELKKGDGVEIKVLDGKVEVQSGKQKKVLDKTKVLTLTADKQKKTLALKEESREEKEKLEKLPPVSLKSVQAKSDLRFLDPPPMARIQVRTDENMKPTESSQVEVKWDDPSNAQVYDLQMSSGDPLFKKDVLTQKVTSKSWKTPDLKPGRYLVRVRPISKEPAPWSEPLEFDFSYRDPGPLPPPVAKRAPPSVVENPTGQPLQFEWAPVLQAERYEVEVATDPTFTKIEKKTLTRDNRYSITDYTPGDYYVRVRAISQQGKPGDFAKVGEVKVAVSRPEVLPVSPVSVMGATNESEPTPVPMAMQWKPVPLAKKYEIEIADNPDFLKADKMTSDSPQKDVIMKKPGKTFFRVRAIASSGQAVTPYSDPGVLQYIFKVPLATPTLLQPEANVTLFFQKTKDNPFWMEWKPVRQANEYFLEIARDREFTNKVFSSKTEKNRLLVKENLPQGRLFWRVKAASEGRESPWSEPRQVNIFGGRQPAGQSR